jgi:hypothetical protein
MKATPVSSDGRVLALIWGCVSSGGCFGVGNHAMQCGAEVFQSFRAQQGGVFGFDFPLDGSGIC